ncbi:hypothetical protein Droror1_Dr00011669 [Drosera rotundifolia]
MCCKVFCRLVLLVIFLFIVKAVMSYTTYFLMDVIPPDCRIPMDPSEPCFTLLFLVFHPSSLTSLFCSWYLLSLRPGLCLSDWLFVGAIDMMRPFSEHIMLTRLNQTTII